MKVMPIFNHKIVLSRCILEAEVLGYLVCLAESRHSVRLLWREPLELIDLLGVQIVDMEHAKG